MKTRLFLFYTSFCLLTAYSLYGSRVEESTHPRIPTIKGVTHKSSSIGQEEKNYEPCQRGAQVLNYERASKNPTLYAEIKGEELFYTYVLSRLKSKVSHSPLPTVPEGVISLIALRENENLFKQYPNINIYLEKKLKINEGYKKYDPCDDYSKSLFMSVNPHVKGESLHYWENEESRGHSNPEDSIEDLLEIHFRSAVFNLVRSQKTSYGPFQKIYQEHYLRHQNRSQNGGLYQIFISPSALDDLCLLQCPLNSNSSTPYTYSSAKAFFSSSQNDPPKNLELRLLCNPESFGNPEKVLIYGHFLCPLAQEEQKIVDEKIDNLLKPYLP